MANGPVRRRRGASSANQASIVPPNQVGETNPSLLANGPDDSLKVAVTYRRVEELKLVRRQLRTHKPKQVDQIVSMIRRCGFINPIIVDAELGIVCGVGRYLAAKQIGLSRVPVIEVGHLTESELRAYALADNKLGHCQVNFPEPQGCPDWEFHAAAADAAFHSAMAAARKVRRVFLEIRWRWRLKVL